jgi:hypothetical protein
MDTLLNIWKNFGPWVVTALPLGSIGLSLLVLVLRPRVELVGRRWRDRCHFVIVHDEEVWLRGGVKIELEVKGTQAELIPSDPPRLLAGPDPAVNDKGVLSDDKKTWTLTVNEVRPQTVWGLEAAVTSGTQLVELRVKAGSNTWDELARSRESEKVDEATIWARVSRTWLAGAGAFLLGWSIYLVAAVANTRLWPLRATEETHDVLDFNELSAWDLVGLFAIAAVGFLAYWVCVGMWRSSGLAGLSQGYLGWEREGTEAGVGVNEASERP